MNIRRHPLKFFWAPRGKLAWQLGTAIIALAGPVLPLRAQSLHERILADEAEDAAKEIIRKEKALRNSSPGSDQPGTSRPERSGRTAHDVWQENENARLDRARRAHVLNVDAHAAWDRRDYREALRLFRAQQQVIDGPNVREIIAQTEATIAWNEATTAAELRRAVAMQPGFFSRENLDYVAAVEAREKRRQLDRTIAADIGFQVGKLAASLDAEPAMALDFMPADSHVVDARRVPSGLPPSVEAEIPATPAGDRVRKGFQAIVDHDWKVARAWFQDALNKEPGNPGLQRLVDLAQFTLDRQNLPPAKPAQPDPATLATMGKIMDVLEQGMNEEWDKALTSFQDAPRPKRFQPGPTAISDEEWLNQKEEYAGWKNFFRLLMPARRPLDPNAPVINSAIRG